ncbi:MAG: phosphoribosylformylglycinamidine synthase [Dehalococcoidales bacterium]|nr:phosphoribosylformylglycinamidine synthase [Dehalococcoidales bacterium]
MTDIRSASEVRLFYRKVKPDFEYCFNVQTSEPLTAGELETIKWLLAETFEPENFSEKPFLVPAGNVVEVGPRLSFDTAYSTNAVAICHACGINKITRIERSRRYLLPESEDKETFVAGNHDRMTEIPYPEPLKSFDTGAMPGEVFTLPLLEEGIDALKVYNHENGLGMDDWDVRFYANLFINDLKRNPTDAELFMLGNNNSEHSRHWFFKGRMKIDGREIPETLLQIIRSTIVKNPSNSVIAFSDDSSAIRGYKIWTIMPAVPGTSSMFVPKDCYYHVLFTAETHNYPSGIEPFEGATTGTGGRIRDGHATGRGSFVIAGTAGYCTASLNMADFPIPGEPEGLVYPFELASPLKILIQASNGASDYGNKFGEPLIQGYVRTFEQILPGRERRAWLKPIMFTGGVGQIDDSNIKARETENGVLIVQVGGPAYRIGMGGGAASSMMQGENIAELDFNAVQRGNAEMENKLNRVIRACAEKGENNPMLNIHDQGAGGPANVLTEIMDPNGGKIYLRRINLGDPSLNVAAIWCAEYQERSALLIHKQRIDEFKDICTREKVNCEVLGEITGDGRVVVIDEKDDSVPVDLPLDRILGDMPPKSYELHRIPRKLEPLSLPENLNVGDALENIFRLPSVGSKGYLVRKVDRSVTGLIAQQQCCGPLQLPVADVAVVAQSHFGLTGGAIAIGEQPIKMLVDEKAGARMAVGEMLTNMIGARISDLTHIKCSVNWMWAAKLPGEGARIYDAVRAVAGLMTDLGIAVDGGKDSLSMAARVGNENVKAPGEVVISGYATMPDITKKLTPDLKYPGLSRLVLIDPSGGKNRLGGSALAQAFGQIGDESPDVDNYQLLISLFRVIQKMIDDELICACHDRSDGGLITTLAEMALSGNCGFSIGINEGENAIAQLFSEELGLVVEYLPDNENRIKLILEEHDLSYTILGDTLQEKNVIITQGEETLLHMDTPVLLEWWESTSDRLEKEQMNVLMAEEMTRNRERNGITYNVARPADPVTSGLFRGENKPKVAIIREEGSNGDREMTSAFFWAGFEPWDVTMTDLLEDRISLDKFRGVVFVGGFSYADVLDPAKGWAGIIKLNPRLKEMFDEFFNREDTFSLGICNGCQLMAFLGIVPWEGIPEDKQPRFITNTSERFESHWGMVRITESPAIMLKGMEESVLGIWSAHGGGKLFCPDPEILTQAREQGLTPVAYVDDEGNPTEKYRYNPNGSPAGIVSFCSRDGRHLAMMPHPERAFLLWQWPYVPEDWKTGNWKKDVGDYVLAASPWLKMFQNAYKWCTGE